MGDDDPLQALRAALRLSPDNFPLRQHLADSLLRMGRPEEAEKEYRQALALAPDNKQIKINLANAFSGISFLTLAIGFSALYPRSQSSDFNQRRANPMAARGDPTGRGS